MRVIKYKVGDIIPALEFDKEMYGIKEVTITSINEETKVYHWESDCNGGKIHSGYYFEWIDNINV